MNKLSIRIKILLINLITIVAAVFLIFIFYINLFKSNIKNEFVNRATSIVNLTIGNIINPLYISDIVSLNQVAINIAGESDVLSVFIIDKDKNILADGTESNSSMFVPFDNDIGMFDKNDMFFNPEKKTFEVFHQVLFGSDVLGYIYLSFDLTKFNQSLTYITFVTIIISAIVLVFMFVANLFLFKIMKPLQLVVRELHVAAEGKGDLTKKIHVASRDEIGDLASNFNHFIVKLSSIVKEIKTVVEDNKAAGENLSAFSRKLIQNINNIGESSSKVSKKAMLLNSDISAVKEKMSNINAFIGEVNTQIRNQTIMITQSSSAIEQISSIIQNVTHNSELKLALVNELKGYAQNGMSEMNKTISIVNQVSSSTDIIFDMIKVIDSIASQTNLLAMNASIEAAHAGNAGRGFAVVASEIRKLAENSAENARMIKSSLENVASTIRQSVHSSEKTGDIFNKVFTEIEQVSQSFSEIHGAMNEMAVGSDQIIQTLNGLVDTGEVLDSSSRKMTDTLYEISDTIITISSFSNDTQEEIVQIDKNIKHLEQFTSAVTKSSEDNLRRSGQLEELVKHFKTD